MNPSSAYLLELTSYLADPQSSEMSYRTAFQNYLASIFPKEEGYFIQHDPKATAGNKPDFIVLKNSVPLLYIEVKKLGENLDKIEKSEQATRYYGYTNLIISDYAEFRFFRNGERYDDVIALAKADTKTHTLIPLADNAERLARTIRDFIETSREPIKSGKHLAKIMGGRAQRIRDNVVAFLAGESEQKDELAKMMRFIKEHLLANLTDEDFADMYAQTLVYGLFAARYNDDTLDDFSREEARRLVPATNPFLRHFFDHISGATFPKRLEVIVDELCEVFTHANVRELMEQYFKRNGTGNTKESPDPVIHFYEDFLREYDPKKKVELGVFYTPLPVVRFIVRGIDELLKREFDLPKGLADNSTTDIEREHTDHKGKTKRVKESVHRVQVLDVATGTGTFLNEAVEHIRTSFAGQEGRWGAYVTEDLLPRLHGFELMMASYTIAHLKVALTLKKSGVEEFGKRLGIYLTNTLDTPHDIPLQGSLFGVLDSIAEESRIASRVKKEYPIMVVMGNPPYSGESQNPHYTDNDVYKVEPGGKEKLKEKNSKWINDDYVKFIRFAESMVEKNGEGIVGMITAHGYLDNPTFRGMRWHLRNTFDAIYVLDLHGNANKKETAPDGSKDENVFDIKTGTAVIFGVKKRAEGKAKKSLATVYHTELYGVRLEKFEALDGGAIERLPWNPLPADCDVWKVEGEGKAEYDEGFSVAELFSTNTLGYQTHRDDFAVAYTKLELEARLRDFIDLSISTVQLSSLYKINVTNWNMDNARRELQKHDPDALITETIYRPFDIRYVILNKAICDRPRKEILEHVLGKNNIVLLCSRQQATKGFRHVYVAKLPANDCVMSTKSREANQVFPLYLYTDSGEKVPNLDADIVQRIEGAVGTTAPEDVLDYVYAVLHAPSYRTKYQEFLKSDFPRVPYPSDREVFWKLVEKGRKLRALHLLEDPIVHKPITTFPVSGTNIVEKVAYKDGRVYINAEQYWDNVPETVWSFYIGGYQPAQKYLKDRKGRSLTNAEFENYERTLVSLNETIKVMEEIDDFAIS